MMFSKIDDEVLRQIRDKSPYPGVHAGDLISKPAARRLVDAGLVLNSGGSSSALGYLSISPSGAALLSAADSINERASRNRD